MRLLGSGSLLSALCLIFAVAAGGCGSCSRTGTTSGDAAVAAEPALPPPAGLVAEVWLRSPDAAWGRLQRGAGGALGLLPSSAGQLACALGGLDFDLAALMDGGATSYAALAEREGDLTWAVAVPLRDDSRAAAVLLAGDASRYVARKDGALRIVSRVDVPLAVAVALAPGWLLMARDEAALLALGPYAYRTIPRERAPSSGAFAVALAQQTAMAGPIAQALLSQWNAARGWLAARDEEQRARHGGRAPDFGDPRVILAALDGAVRRRVSLASEAQSARLELDIADDCVRMDLAVVPGEGEAPSRSLVGAMRPGDALPLARAPFDAVFAALLRDDSGAREASARDLEGVVAGLLGDRLKAEDAHAVHAALEDWAHGRGDWLTAAFPWGESRGLSVRTPAADRAVATRAVRELLGLLQRPPFGDPVAKALSVGPPALGATQIPSLGTVSVATFPSKAGPVDGKASPLGVAWGVRDGDLLLSVGEEAPHLLAAQATPSPSLGDDPLLARALANLGSDAELALVAQPLRLDPARTVAGSAFAVAAVGRRSDAFWAHLEVSDVLVRELVRLGAGL